MIWCQLNLYDTQKRRDMVIPSTLGQRTHEIKTGTMSCLKTTGTDRSGDENNGEPLEGVERDKGQK